MSESVIFKTTGHVGIITIHHPKANQLTNDVMQGIRKILDASEQDPALRALVLTGYGDRIFSAGADLTEGFGDLSPVDFLKRGQDLNNKIENYPKPIIAAINGHALGGGTEMALACHFRFMKEDATIGLTETNLGIIPGYGGTLRLTRITGREKALELMIFGEKISSDEALRLGIISRMYPRETLLDETIRFGELLSERPPLAIRALLKILSISPGISPEYHLRVEREELAKLFPSNDVKEGITAFFGKRKPHFTGE